MHTDTKRFKVYVGLLCVQAATSSPWRYGRSASGTDWAGCSCGACSQAAHRHMSGIPLNTRQAGLPALHQGFGFGTEQW